MVKTILSTGLDFPLQSIYSAQRALSGSSRLELASSAHSTEKVVVVVSAAASAAAAAAAVVVVVVVVVVVEVVVVVVVAVVAAVTATKMVAVVVGLFKDKETLKIVSAKTYDEAEYNVDMF
ncbi:hypothetical protein ElyMa_003778400 [Elysia marginata]|uniref:Uncharacterized protein n=1 Tax=Elysia marginata TaxID=1093978 RepID=A0AAV4FAF1_9GAST|nr:hypothetical protein ElyMa_003778400 [Elysia marginata]